MADETSGNAQIMSAPELNRTDIINLLQGLSESGDVILVTNYGEPSALVVPITEQSLQMATHIALLMQLIPEEALEGLNENSDMTTDEIAEKLGIER